MSVNFLFVSLILFNADFGICTAPDTQFLPTAIYANNRYYVFWTDDRPGQVSYSLYGARVSTSGVVLDPNGKLLVRDSLPHARVAYDGANFLIVARQGC